MKLKEIGKSGIFASEISIGTFGMGGGTAWSDTGNDTAASVRLLEEAYDRGVTFFDSAPVYGGGQAEEILAQAIRGRRDKVVIGTKCSLQWREEYGLFEYTRDGRSVYRDFRPESLRKDLEDSLRRLGTDYIDVYITHRQPAVEEVPEVMDTMLRFKQEGKIRAIGISNATTDHLAAYLACGQVDLAQEQLSLLGRTRLDSYIPLCEKAGVTFQTYRALEEGALTGKMPADFAPPPGDVRRGLPWFQPGVPQKLAAMLAGFRPLTEKYGCSLAVLACAWAKAQSPSINLLVGARKMPNLIDTLQVQDIELDPADADAMTAAAKALEL